MQPAPWRIVVPLDGSSEGEGALSAIEPLLHAGGVEVTLFHVSDRNEPVLKARSYLSGVSERLRARGIEADFDLRPGRLVQEIVSYAQESRADLIAMSPHRKTVFSRLFAGSVTEQVLRRANVPVLSCPEGSSGRPWSRILVPLDGTPLSEGILPEATSIAKRVNAPLELLRVVVPIVTAADGGWVPIYATIENPLPYLKGICSRVEAQGVEARPISTSGHVVPEVLRIAREIDASLVCMSTHGRTGWARLAFGSATEGVLRKAPCPVLVRRMTAVAAQIPTGATAV